jgi:uncharacterized protein (TIGR02246 family)
MKSRSVFAVAAAMIVTTIAYATPSCAQSPGDAEDEAAIRRVIVEMTEGFNHRDASASTRMYTADADLVTVRGERFHGTEGFEKGLASIFAGRAREAALKTLNVSVRFIRPDIAVAHVTNELSGLIAPDGQRPPPNQELSLRVFVKEANQWKVAAFHNTMLAPFASPAASK